MTLIFVTYPPPLGSSATPTLAPIALEGMMFGRLHS
jgi:hypothetical protein